MAVRPILPPWSQQVQVHSHPIMLPVSAQPLSSHPVPSLFYPWAGTPLHARVCMVSWMSYKVPGAKLEKCKDKVLNRN